MLNTKLFPEFSFTASELTDIAVHITHPSVQKYLKRLAQEQIEAIVHGIANDGEAAESYLRRQAVVQGQLAVLETLLAIESPATQA